MQRAVVLISVFLGPFSLLLRKPRAGFPGHLAKQLNEGLQSAISAARIENAAVPVASR